MFLPACDITNNINININIFSLLVSKEFLSYISTSLVVQLVVISIALGWGSVFEVCALHRTVYSQL